MKPKKVMVIDDDTDFLDVFKEILIRHGYDVTAISESVSAIKVARAVRPDIILLDLRMASVSGFEIADGLKRFQETSAIPIIAITGFYTLKEESWLMNYCGIRKCLRKPFDPVEAIGEIESILGEDGHKKG